MSHVCPHCGEEIKVEIGVPSPPPGRDWKRLALLAALALLAVAGACAFVVYWR